MSAIFILPRDRLVDGNGKPYGGAKLYFYNVNSLVDKMVFQDAAMTVPNAHPQPVVCDSAGLIPLIYLSGSYKVIITTSTGTLIYEADNQDAPLTTSGGVLGIAQGGTGAGTAPGALAALGAAAQTALDALAATVGAISTTIGGYPAFGALAARTKLLNTDLDATNFAPVCIQRSLNTTATRQALSGIIPLDNTAPLRSEGDTLFSVSFTPKKATSILRVRASMFVAGNGSTRNGVLALFAPGTGPSDTAIATAGGLFDAGGTNNAYELEHEFLANQITPMTIQLNMGASGPYVVNGTPSAGLFNGTMLSRLLIEEYHQP